MIVQCPNCKTKYSLEEALFAGRAGAQVRCRKCQASFTVSASPMRQSAPQPAAAEATQLAGVGEGLELPIGKIVALSATKGPLTGQVFRLDKPRVLVGRQGADIELADPEVSRKHCSVEVHGATATLVDLGTTNGTFVDGEKIQSRELEHLSEFRIGATTLLFMVTDEE